MATHHKTSMALSRWRREVLLVGPELIAMIAAIHRLSFRCQPTADSSSLSLLGMTPDKTPDQQHDLPRWAPGCSGSLLGPSGSENPESHKTSPTKLAWIFY